MILKLFDLQEVIDRFFNDVWLAAWPLDDL
jgi:hypothetical protein